MAVFEGGGAARLRPLSGEHSISGSLPSAFPSISVCFRGSNPFQLWGNFSKPTPRSTFPIARRGRLPVSSPARRRRLEAPCARPPPRFRCWAACSLAAPAPVGSAPAWPTQSGPEPEQRAADIAESPGPQGHRRPPPPRKNRSAGHPTRLTGGSSGVALATALEAPRFHPRRRGRRSVSPQGPNSGAARSALRSPRVCGPFLAPSLDCLPPPPVKPEPLSAGQAERRGSV